MNQNDQTTFLKTVFDALPSFIFIVDKDVRIIEYNLAASGLLMNDRDLVLKERAGDILHCVHSLEDSKGCGNSILCEDCVIRNSVDEAYNGKKITRKRTRMEILRGEKILKIYALITASPFYFENKKLVLLIIEDISEIAELYNIIPICSVCRKIQDKSEAWMKIEAYFKNNWDLDFSHGLCPECYQVEIGKLKTKKN